jgi:CRP-like cAMP-binding protein
MDATNFILDSLPSADREWLRPRLEVVELTQGRILYQAREQITHVYFPTTCLISLTNSTLMGEIVEVAITGNEGVTGTILLLDEDISPWQAEAQLAGQALKLSKQDFVTALNQSSPLRQRVAAFTYLKMVQINQSALCNRFHSLEERLCRWLLSASDRTQSSEFALTREILAQMIGAGRPSVSLTTRTLETAGMLRSTRGNITILNREWMEDTACECYQITKTALEHYLVKKI